MSIKDLLAAQGGLATRKPVAKRIVWEGSDDDGNPTKIDADFHFLSLSAEESKSLLKERDGVDGDVQFVAGILCEPDGKPALKLEEARKLKLTLLAKLVSAGLEVIGLGKSSKDEAKKD